MVVQPVQHDSHRWHPENLSATLIQGSMGKICQWTNLGTVRTRQSLQKNMRLLLERFSSQNG